MLRKDFWNIYHTNVAATSVWLSIGSISFVLLFKHNITIHYRNNYNNITHLRLSTTYYYYHRRRRNLDKHVRTIHHLPTSPTNKNRRRFVCIYNLRAQKTKVHTELFQSLALENNNKNYYKRLD